MSRKRDHLVYPISIGCLVLFAGLALGQNADKNSAGPTKNDLRLRVVEPVEGAMVVGHTVRVTVANSLPRTTQESTGTANMPNPSFRVYLGNTLKGELKRDENVLTIENVDVGDQRLVVEAMNPSGEVIDRKEIRFRTVATSSEAASSSTPVTAPPAPQTAAAPVPEHAAAPATVPEPSMTARTLPQTASGAPRAALAGLALVVAGLLVSRKPGARTIESSQSR